MPSSPAPSWKTAFRSFYYEDTPAPDPPPLDPSHTAFLVIDVQNTYLDRPAPETLTPAQQARYDAWTPFHRRLETMVIPNTRRMLDVCRARGIECLFARIGSLTPDGRDRSLTQRMPGWNDVHMPHRSPESQVIDALAPRDDEIVLTKTTDSAVTGTNLRLLLSNMGIRTVVVAGLFTDQCVSSTVRSLADESFHTVVLHDCCAAGTDALHEQELTIINRLYCLVMGHGELIDLLDRGR